MTDKVSDSTLIALGHSSVVVATLLGAGMSLTGMAVPAYGFTVAWALAAVSNNVKPDKDDWSETWKAGARVQKMLAAAGSAICAVVATYAAFF